MEKKQLSKNGAIAGLIISGLLLIAVIIASAFVFLNFMGDVIVAGERTFIQSGDIVHVNESRTYRIYLEAERQPWISHHNFVFIDMDDNSRIYSRSAGSVSSQYNNLIETAADGTTRFVSGRRVANVDLDIGRYIVEFAALPAGIAVVWDHNIFGDIGGGVTSFVVWTMVLSVVSLFALAGIIVFAIKLGQAIKREKRSA